MLIYISGKISGKENFVEDFERAECWLKLNDYKPINPAKLNSALPQLSYEEFMQIDYKLIDLCDGIYMLDGWQKSKGACAELAYAKSLGKKVFYQKYFKEFRNVPHKI